MNDHERERDEGHVIEALHRMRDEVEVPPFDPTREAALLSAFDARWARPRRRMGRMAWTSALAASIVITVALDWLVWTHGTHPGDPKADPTAEVAGFVPWPGAQGWPPFESGEVMRVELPVSMLPALGLAPASDVTIVEADIVFGQDGFARAVRLVP
jgi:hypothetical protein